MGNGGEKVSWKRVLILAGAVIAFTIGSGFATGQEIIQYYTAYGVQSLLVILVFAVAFLYYNFNFAKAGAEQKFERGNDVYKYFCGKYVGTFCDYYSTLFCYMSFFVMIGGAASTLHQEYDLPTWVGGVILAALAILTVVGGLNSLVDAIGIVGPVIVVLCIAIGLITCSTLLKAIAGIFAPDQGTITLATPSVSLLSIGVGFQRKLTGRENVMLSGMLLGFSEQQILEKMDEIIEFAEIGSFIDRPVKTYSSGMFSKLAFSITAVLETDIMLIDEILSVGDTKFKKKSYEKMKELIFDKNRTVMIVSHNPDTVRQLCTSVLWIHEGKVRMQGDVETVLEAYEREA